MNYDAIWQNPQFNTTAWSYLRDTTIVDSQFLLTTPDSTWKLSATADFDRDGELDLLWRHQSGATQWWLMRDGQFKDVQVIQPIANQAWQIVGTGDFDGDGHLDLLWRDRSSGNNQIWLMPPVRSSPVLSPKAAWDVGLVPLDWDVSTTGDVNQDGVTDILWTHRTSGSSQWWQMEQGRLKSWSSLPPLKASEKVTASEDFNGDGTLDLVVQDVTLGTSGLWLMSKFVPSGTMSIVGKSAITTDSRLGQAGWKITGITKVDAGNTLGNATIVPNAVFSRSETIGGIADQTDIYKFNLAISGQFTASLSSLSADADLRVIADRNNNGQIDSGEVLAWPWERGSKAESLNVFLQSGSYFLEVRSADTKLTNYQLSTSFSQAAAARKLDLQISYDPSSNGLDPATRSAIATAERFWENIISGGNFLSGNTLPIKIVTEDLNLKTGEPDTFTLAYSAPTMGSDGQKLLIQSATITINRRRLGTIDQQALNDLFIHEFTHALGFGTLWEPLRFRNADGSIRAIGAKGDANSLIDRSTNRYRADTFAGWVYGEQLRDAGKASTITATAVPIEAGLFAHWDESIFQTESLTPIADSGNQPISRLTLAALSDLGWQVNMDAAQAYSLPTTASALPDIDFGNLNRPPAAGSVASNGPTAPSHSSSCGCATHLFTDRPNLATLVGIG
jgi:FG-GAP-like repeat